MTSSTRSHKFTYASVKVRLDELRIAQSDNTIRIKEYEDLRRSNISPVDTIALMARNCADWPDEVAR